MARGFAPLPLVLSNGKPPFEPMYTYAHREKKRERKKERERMRACTRASACLSSLSLSLSLFLVLSVWHIGYIHAQQYTCFFVFLFLSFSLSLSLSLSLSFSLTSPKREQRDYERIEWKEVKREAPEPTEG